MDSNSSGLNIKNTLRSIEEYSEAELLEFSKYSLVSKNYLALINQKNIPSIYKTRHTAWLQASLASFFDNASNDKIFAYWSQAMDEVLLQAKDICDLKHEPLDLLALGKYGSQVLNLSSDIDLLFISNAPTDSLIKKTRDFIRLINQKTEWGFISRVDLNLKPNSMSDRLIISPQSLVNYLWQSTELWERLVYTRSRLIFSNLDQDTSKDYLQMINKFCYRKYVNLKIIEDLAGLLQKILSNNHDTQNVKLRSGGIRSIELFFSSLQLLYGGRDPDLQVPNSYQLLDTLSDKPYIQKKSLKILAKNYDFLRRTENLIQIQTDSQDHSINTKVPIDKSKLNQICLESRDILTSFIDKFSSHRIDPSSAPLPIVETIDPNDLSHLPHMENLNSFFTKRPRYKDLILSHPKAFKSFLKALKYSPFLSRILLLRPELLDLYLVKKTIIDSKADDEIFLSQLVDYKLLNYITAIGDFLIHFNVDTLTNSISLTSDKCIQMILEKVFGPDSDIRILKLGKWASEELGLKSDLDFVFLSDTTDVDLKKIRKVIHYISHHTFHGAFYDIDLRLRPSGSAGPIVTSTNQLVSFVNSSDPNNTWLKQSYLRNSFLDNGKKLDLKAFAPLTLSQKQALKEIRLKRLLSLESLELSIKESEGGLIDLEFFVQYLCLENQVYPANNSFQGILDELHQLKLIASPLYMELGSIYRYLRTTEQICTLRSLNRDIKISKDNATSIFDLPASASNFYISSLSYLNLKEVLQNSSSLIKANLPFFL